MGTRGTSLTPRPILKVIPAEATAGTMAHIIRLLLKDPRGEGPWPAPGRPPTPYQKFFLQQKMKFIEGAGNLRPIVGTQTFFWPLTPP